MKNSPILYNDPSGHDSIISEFFAGVTSEVVSSIGWFIPPLQADLAPRENESVAKLAGRVVGDIASIAIGVLEVGAGGGAITGGTLCAGLTAGGCLPVGAPTVVAGAALALEGAGTGVRGTIGLVENLALMAKKYNRREYGGSQSTSNAVADKLKKEGAYQACPECGESMVPGTKHAPSPEHNPPLVKHWWEKGGQDMSYEERVAYAQSENAFNGTICLQCQKKQGGVMAQFSRFMNRIFGVK